MALPPRGPRLAAEMLRAEAIEDMRVGLQAAIETPTGLDDTCLVDTIAALERLTCTITATQAALAVELDTSIRASEEDAGIPPARRGRGVAAMLGLARRESPHRAARRLSLAKVTATELPHTWAAWRAGRVTEWRTTLIARETACLDLPDRLAVDTHVAGDADAFETMSDRDAESAARAHGEQLDPGAHVVRRRHAEAERHVSLRPAPDTMTWLTALLPVKDGVAAFAALTRAADQAQATGDNRTRGQVMADELVSRVLTNTSGDSPAAAVALNLVMTDHALLGDSDEPAHLDTYGPIPAELAREIVCDQLTTSEELWLRRLYTAPDTGQLQAMDSRARLFPIGLARFIRLRDQHCRTPWCNAPIRHIDHALDHADGGPTTGINGQGLCEACNHAKQAHRWRARPGPDGSITTTTPTGHTYRSRPPAVATITRRHDLPQLRIDYVLTG